MHLREGEETRLGNHAYRIERHLANGAIVDVYLAILQNGSAKVSDYPVAIKLVRSEYRDDEEWVGAIRREAWVLEVLNQAEDSRWPQVLAGPDAPLRSADLPTVENRCHYARETVRTRRVIGLLDCGEVEGQPFLVQEVAPPTSFDPEPVTTASSKEEVVQRELHTLTVALAIVQVVALAHENGFALKDFAPETSHDRLRLAWEDNQSERQPSFHLKVIDWNITGGKEEQPQDLLFSGGHLYYFLLKQHIMLDAEGQPPLNPGAGVPGWSEITEGSRAIIQRLLQRVPDQRPPARRLMSDLTWWVEMLRQSQPPAALQQLQSQLWKEEGNWERVLAIADLATRIGSTAEEREPFEERVREAREKLESKEMGGIVAIKATGFRPRSYRGAAEQLRRLLETPLAPAAVRRGKLLLLQAEANDWIEKQSFIANPDQENPDQENPDQENPDQASPDEVLKHLDRGVDALYREKWHDAEAALKEVVSHCPRIEQGGQCPSFLKLQKYLREGMNIQQTEEEQRHLRDAEQQQAEKKYRQLLEEEEQRRRRDAEQSAEEQRHHRDAAAEQVEARLKLLRGTIADLESRYHQCSIADSFDVLIRQYLDEISTEAPETTELQRRVDEEILRLRNRQVQWQRYETILRQAEEHRQAGRYDSAVKSMKAAFEILPLPVHPALQEQLEQLRRLPDLLDKARRHRDAGRTDEALDLLQDILQRYPDQPEATQFFNEILQQRKIDDMLQQVEADVQSKKATNSHADAVVARRNGLGRLLQDVDLDLPDEARSILSKLLKLRDESVEDPAGFLAPGLPGFSDDTRWEKARDLQKQLFIIQEPTGILSRVALAANEWVEEQRYLDSRGFISSLGQLGHYEEAYAVAKREIQRRPDDPEIFKMLQDNAERIRSRANDSANKRLGRASKLLHQGDPEEALANLRSIEEDIYQPLEEKFPELIGASSDIEEIREKAKEYRDEAEKLQKIQEDMIPIVEKAEQYYIEGELDKAERILLTLPDDDLEKAHVLRKRVEGQKQAIEKARKEQARRAIEDNTDDIEPQAENEIDAPTVETGVSPLNQTAISHGRYNKIVLLAALLGLLGIILVFVSAIIGPIDWFSGNTGEKTPVPVPTSVAEMETPQQPAETRTLPPHSSHTPATSTFDVLSSSPSGVPLEPTPCPIPQHIKGTVEMLGTPRPLYDGPDTTDPIDFIEQESLSVVVCQQSSGRYRIAKDDCTSTSSMYGWMDRIGKNAISLTALNTLTEPLRGTINVPDANVYVQPGIEPTIKELPEKTHVFICANSLVHPLENKPARSGIMEWAEY
jgi:tetratricopeptide (TPR) repeat protein